MVLYTSLNNNITSLNNKLKHDDDDEDDFDNIDDKC